MRPFLDTPGLLSTYYFVILLNCASVNSGTITDPCLSNPCNNGGTCPVTAGVFICECQRGLTGSFCELVDPFESCPESIHVDLPPGETQAYVTWDEPRVRVHDGFVAEAVNASRFPGSFFTVGRHSVVYDYHDDNDAVLAKCAFYVNITGQVVPFIRSCPRNIKAELTGDPPHAYVTWSEPQVIGQSVNITVAAVTADGRVMMPGTMFLVGLHEMAYKFWHGLNESDGGILCSFNITIISKNLAFSGHIDHCSSSSTNFVLGFLLGVSIVASCCFFLMFFRIKIQARHSSGRPGSMTPLETVSKPVANNESTVSESRDNLTHRRNNIHLNELPPVPLPKPTSSSTGRLLDNRDLELAYDVHDNYGYLCFELKKQTDDRGVYEVPCADYGNPK